MGSSYYITYGGNRLTFPGATGSVAWEYTPSGYYEQRLWSGNMQAQNSTAGFSAHPSAFDDIRIVCGGGNQLGNSMLYGTVQFPYSSLATASAQDIELPMFGTTATSGVNQGWFFGGVLSGCSGTSWKLTKAYGRLFTNTAYSERYDFFQVREIWGVHYG